MVSQNENIKIDSLRKMRNTVLKFLVICSLVYIVIREFKVNDSVALNGGVVYYVKRFNRIPRSIAEIEALGEDWKVNLAKVKQNLTKFECNVMPNGDIQVNQRHNYIFHFSNKINADKPLRGRVERTE